MLGLRNQSFFRQISRKYSSTANEDEIRKFGKLSNEWWDTSGPFKGLHSLNKIRVPFVKNGLRTHHKSLFSNSTLSSPLAGATILDVGCGGGLLSESLARLGASVTAIDPTEECITAASLHAQKSKLKNITYKVSTIEQLRSLNPVPVFDAITASEVIEHVEDSQFFIKMCTELLKPGGSLFVTTINRTTASWLLAICAAEYVMNIVPKGTHNWNKFITPEEMINYMKNNGCQLRQLHGMSYNPFTNNWDWTSIPSVNYAIHATKRLTQEDLLVEDEQLLTQPTASTPLHTPLASV